MDRKIKALFLFFAIIYLVAAFGDAAAQEKTSGEEKAAKDEEISKEQLQLNFANGLFIRREWEMAADEYIKFITNYPKHPQIETARYFLAESYYWLYENNKEKGPNKDVMQKAVEAYNNFLTGYPESKYVHNALLHLNTLNFFSGDFEKAIDGFNKLLDNKQTPEKIKYPAMYYLGKCYYQKGAYEEALKRFEKISGVDGNFASQANYLIADIYNKLKKNEEAKKRYYLLIDKFPGDKPLLSESYLRIGEIAFELGQYAEAEKAFKVVTEKYSDLPQYEPSASGLVWSLFQQKKFKDTVSEVDLFLKTRPETSFVPSMRYIKGMALLELQLYKDSSETFALVAKIAPKNASEREWVEKSYLQIVWCDFLMKDFDAVIKSATRFIGEYPKSVFAGEIYYLMGSAYFSKKEFASAIHRFEELQKEEKYKKTDFMRSGTYQLAMSAYLLAEEKNDKNLYLAAAKYLDDFFSSYPDDKLANDALLKSGECYRRVEVLASAEERFAKYVELYRAAPNREEVMFQLGIVRFQLGKHDEMAKTMTAMLSEFPKGTRRSGGYFYIGWNLENAALAKENDKKLLDEAISWFDKVINDSHNQYMDEALMHRAICWYRMEKFENAAEDFYVVLTKSRENKMSDKTLFWLVTFFGNKLQEMLENKDEQKIARKDIESVNNKAIIAAQKLLELYPETNYLEQVLFRIGEFYRIAEKWDSAEKYYKELLKKYPATKYVILINYGLGTVYKGTKQYDQALEYFVNVTKHSTGYYSNAAVIDIADVYFAQQKYDEALREYLRIGIQTRNLKLTPRALFGAGLCFLKTDKSEKAVKYFKEIIEDYPKSTYAEDAAEEIKKVESKP